MVKISIHLKGRVYRERERERDLEREKERSFIS